MIDGCKNNPENSSAANVGKCITSGFIISSFKSVENNHDLYRDEDCMKKDLWIILRASNKDE